MRIPLAWIAAVVCLGESSAAQAPAKWRLVEEWRVGGAIDGAHSLNNVRAIRVAPDGRIIVLEAKDQQVHILSNRGDSIRTIGRKGAGPGEFQNATGLVVGRDGQIIVHDIGNARLTFLAPNGNVARTISHAPWGESAPWDAQFRADGRLEESARILKMDPVMAVATTSQPIRRTWSADYGSVDTTRAPDCPNLAEAPSEETSWQVPSGRGYMSAAYPFVLGLRARTDAPDGTYWIGLYPEYQRIQRVTFGTCNVVATATLTGTPMAVPADALREIGAMLDRPSRGAANPTAPTSKRMRKTLPQFEAMAVDALGQLWVERLVPRSVKYTYANWSVTGDRYFAIYSAGGKLLAEAAAPLRMGTPRTGRPFTITAERVYAIATDDNDVPYLVAYRIVRS